MLNIKENKLLNVRRDKQTPTAVVVGSYGLGGSTFTGSTGCVYCAGEGLNINGSVISACFGSTSTSVACGNHEHSNYAMLSGITGTTGYVPMWSSSADFCKSPICTNGICVSIGVASVAGYHLTTCNIFGCVLNVGTICTNTVYPKTSTVGSTLTLSVLPTKTQSIVFKSICGATPGTTLILNSGGTATFSCNVITNGCYIGNAAGLQGCAASLGVCCANQALCSQNSSCLGGVLACQYARLDNTNHFSGTTFYENVDVSGTFSVANFYADSAIVQDCSAACPSLRWCSDETKGFYKDANNSIVSTYPPGQIHI